MAIRPTIVQTSLDLSIVPVEDSAGGFPGNLEGANKSIIIGDSASDHGVDRLVQMPQFYTDSNNYLLSGQGQSSKQLVFSRTWGDSAGNSSHGLYDSADKYNALLWDSASKSIPVLKINNFTGQPVDSAALETFVHTTHTSLHRGHFQTHSSGQIQDLDTSQSVSGNQMYWDQSRSMTTIGGRSTPNTNTSYNFGYLRGSNQTWPQDFTIYAVYYPRGTDQDEWYQHLNNQHLVQIERTDNNGSMYVGGQNNLQYTGLTVPHAQWSRIIITGQASSNSTGASTTYEAYVNGVKGNTMTATGVVGRHLSSTSGGYRFRYYYYNTGYFLELGVLDSALGASDISTLDAMLNYQLTFSGGASSTTLTESSGQKYTYGSRFGDSNYPLNVTLPVFNNTSDSNYKPMDASDVFASIKINPSSDNFRVTAPALQKKIIISDSGGSTFIDDTPLNLTSGIAGDSARFKGEREHFHQRITTLTPNNDPRLKTVPEVGGGGGTSGPVQSWS